LRSKARIFGVDAPNAMTSQRKGSPLLVRAL